MTSGAAKRGNGEKAPLTGQRVNRRGLNGFRVARPSFPLSRVRQAKPISNRGPGSHPSEGFPRIPNPHTDRAQICMRDVW
jgi:hypothetical protein